MGEYFDLVADRFGLPQGASPVASRRPKQQLSPLQLSFMSESRRLLNQRDQEGTARQAALCRVEDGVAAAWRKEEFVLIVKVLHLWMVVSWFAGLFYLPRIFVNLAMVSAGQRRRA
jgi:hypothetical protein